MQPKHYFEDNVDNLSKVSHLLDAQTRRVIGSQSIVKSISAFVKVKKHESKMLVEVCFKMASVQQLEIRGRHILLLAL